MKVVSTILLKFKNKTKHLKALVKKMSTQKFGRLKVFPAVGDCGKTASCCVTSHFMALLMNTNPK